MARIVLGSTMVAITRNRPPAFRTGLHVQIVELERDVGPYRKGWHWAEPDMDHAAALMRHVYQHRDEARQVGERAQRDVEREPDPVRIRGLIRDRPDAVSSRAAR